MSTYLISDTGVMLGRSMRHVTRSTDTIITVTIMPIAFMLLFVYVFGGAIQAGTDNYVNYLMPGILLIAIASGISYTGLPAVQRHAERNLRAVPLDADRTVVRAVGTCADLAGVQRDLRRGHHPGGARSWASAPRQACSPGSPWPGSWPCSPSP